mgnify:CR=1 FL=1
MVFGTFDGLHQGHLSYFKQARKYGDYLIAVVALDKNVLKFKGHQPKFSARQRLKVVKECGLVDKIILGNKNIYQVFKQYHPDVACIGYDQQADIKKLRLLFPAMKIVRLKAYKPKIYKSSLLNSVIARSPAPVLWGGATKQSRAK